MPYFLYKNVKFKLKPIFGIKMIAKTKEHYIFLEK